MRKHTVIFTTVLAVALVCAVVFSCCDVAWADTVSVVYPNSGYIQAENVDVLGANQNFLVTYDNTNKVLSVSGDKHVTAPFDNAVDKILVFGDKAILKSEKDFYLFDLTAVTITKTDAFYDCYLSTDGVKLYAHSWGKVDVYDSTLTLESTHSNDVFKNKPIMVADGENVFSFAVDYGVNKLCTYNISSGEANTFDSIFVENALVGDVIFAHNGEEILLIDKTTFETTATGITEKNFAVSGNTLYVAKGDGGYDTYAYTDGALNFGGNFSYTGDGLDKLNSPTDVINFGGKTVIADSKNNRILFVSDSTISLDVTAPKTLASSGTRLYVSSDDGIVVIENMAVKNTVSTDLVIKDMLYSDRLYVLTENGVYTLISGSLIKVFDVNGGKAFASSTHFYVLENNSVSVYHDDGSVNELLSFAVTDCTALDLVVDKVGNVFILGDDGAVHTYFWQDVVESNLGGATLSSTTIPLEFDTYSYTAKSMSDMGDNLVFVTGENALVSISNPMEKTTPSVETVDLENATADIYTSTASTYFMTNSADGRTVTKVDADLMMVAYIINGVAYTKFDGKTGWMFNLGTVAPDTSVSGNYIAKSDLALYVNPLFDSDVTVTTGTVLDVIDDASGYDEGKWVRVSYGGKIYFAESAQLEKVSVTPTPPPADKDEEPEKVVVNFGRAKSSRAGELVALYSSTDCTEVSALVKDGTKLEIVEKVGDFYKVKYDGKEMFIHKDNFKLEGLTTVQIIAIVLSVVVVLAGGLVFMVTTLTKKKEENR